MQKKKKKNKKKRTDMKSIDDAWLISQWVVEEDEEAENPKTFQKAFQKEEEREVQTCHGVPNK
jgi:hypothetical protein